ncbi:hypothetical protein [Fimbriiglobus ruber]|uniref:Type V secretory pathway, adhesin AidA n=1 Tax=Fimbriiglobus ruber TaxID=1908690 RepID=A0A225E979_9BACT|nr:hypothetical protein [Fimbriiglobus ruber]OWK46616.1 Type V secretory pathway, adhesin AidA [Fimbriiglobus ruber]
MTTPAWIKATGTTINKWLIGLTGKAATLDASGLSSAQTYVLPATGGTFTLDNLANTFTTSPQTIDIASASAKGLVVQAANGQTANLTEWQNYIGTAVASVDASGNVFGTGWTNEPDVIGGRLSASNEPYPNGDQIGVSTLYFVQYKGNQESLIYSGTTAKTLSASSSITLSLTGLTSGKLYDVFVYDNSGTKTLYLGPAWTNSSTRATGISTFDGIPYLTGDSTKRYVGTFQATGTTTTEDSLANRYVYDHNCPDYKATTNANRVTFNGLVDAGTSPFAQYAASGTYTGGNLFNNSNTFSGTNTFSNTNSFTATATFSPASTTTQGIIVKGVASQTGDLQEWKNSSNAVLASVSAAGVFTGVFSDMPLWTTSVTYAVGAQVRGSDGNWYRCQTSQSGNDPTADAGGNWLPSYIFNGFTLNVGSGQRFTTLQAALSFLAAAFAVANSTCTVQIANGTYTENVGIYGPLGGNVTIQGNVLNTSSVQIQVATSTEGLHIARDGLSVTLQYLTITKVTGSSLNDGVVMDTFSDLTISNCAVSNLAVGVYITAGRCEMVNAISISGCSNGVVVQEGAHVLINSSSATISSNGIGVNATIINGSIGIISAGITSNTTYGVAAGIGGKVSCNSVTFTSNATACYAVSGGDVSLSGCTFTTNTTNYSPALNTFGNNGGLVRG